MGDKIFKARILLPKNFKTISGGQRSIYSFGEKESRKFLLYDVLTKFSEAPILMTKFVECPHRDFPDYRRSQRGD